MMKTNKRSVLLLLLGLIFIAASLFWARYNSVVQRRAGENTERVLSQLYRQVPKTEELSVEPDTVAFPVATETPDYILNPVMPMPVCEIEGVLYIGYLTIPDLDLELSVASEWDYPTLDITPCRYTGSVNPDDLVISAHNYGPHFASIGTLQPGSPVYFTDMDGNVFRYRVALIEVLMPNDYTEMTRGEYPLTLFTCTSGGNYRLTVRCEQIESSVF